MWPCQADAARVILRILDSLAKLHGIDAPARVAVGPTISEIEFANEAARLIESIASLGATDDLFRSLPGGAGQAVIDAREPAVLPEHAYPAHTRSRAQHCPRVPVDDDFEPWSNI